MKLEQSFEVEAPVDRVWATLLDVERVAPCLPGAAVTGRNDDGSYAGTFSVKIGPTTASYTGKLTLENVDEQARTATIQANGTDRRGQGGARATIVSTVTPAGEHGARVEVVTDYQITGRLARFGRGGMIEDISEKLLTEFAQRLQASLAGDGVEPAAAENGAGPSLAEADEVAAPPGPSEQPTAPAAAAPEPPPAPATEADVEPLQANSLLASVLWNRARSNPVGLGAIVVGLLTALALLRRRR
jgi:carbon monoxide dehydrogenase subunit G